ncbi:hypothetical protein VPNG_02563 [Cytospora leucostoma]|uniref:Uncharacterized protein n=1 Tax=Cytospora leucostoma TaxID=1230097 RepID=A0A423XIV9_9PEZI|nr:hypothetical protein VPNG_02563 [Cytospora leucostoma]
MEPVILVHEEGPELFEDPVEPTVSAEAATYHGSPRQQWRPYGPARPNRPPRRDLHSYESSSASSVSDLFDQRATENSGGPAEVEFVLPTVAWVRGNPEDLTSWVLLEVFYPPAGLPHVAGQHHRHEYRDRQGSPRDNAESRSERYRSVSPRRSSAAEDSDTPSDEDMYEPTATNGLDFVDMPRDYVTGNHDEHPTEVAPRPEE